MKKRILSFLLVLCMCLTLVPVTVLADDDVQQINDAAVQAITPGSDVSVLSVVPDTGAYHTYEFYVDGEKIDTQIVKNGDTLYEPPVTAPAGKTFTGWNPKVTFGTVSNVDKTETITVNAQFDEGYHVYFKDPDGRIIVTKTGKTNDTISVADVNFPVGRDEAITGWYTDAAHTQKVESVTINGADITLYAKVEKGYWLTFESNGGSYVAPAFYANCKTATAPTKPAKSGYTFVNWYTDEGLTTAADFSRITATTTLYAKWKENGNTSYTVIHWLENADDDGYSYKESETKTGTTGDTTNATAKSYTGFTAQTITQETIKGDGSTIVSVYYKRNEYSVKFYTNSSLFSASTEYTALRITAKYGANISAKWPTYNGSSTWATSNNGSKYQVNIDTMPLNGANFYGPQTGNGSETAYYYVEALPGETGTPGPGNLNYKLHHSDTSPGTGYHVTDEDKYPITGFTFKEFSATRAWGGKYNYNNAKFYYTRNSYDLVFISGGKTVKTESVKYQASIAGYANYTPSAAPEGKDGYIFAGWYDNELGEGTAYVFNGKTMPAQSITLYAKWVAPTYTVTVYDVDDETVLETFTKVPMNSTIDEANMPVDEVTKDTDDEFLGWVLKSDDDNSLDGMPFNFSTKITRDYELRAKVGSKAQYSVTYNPNSGTGSMTDNEKYAKGAKATVKSNGFNHDTKVFLSWNTAADGKGETYYPNGTVEITGDVTLYAQWGDKASTVSVTYHSNFDTDQTKTVNGIANNGQITVADYSATGLPARKGYTFAGWKNKEGISFSANDPARVDNGSNDLYAQWTINQYAYTVEYYIDGEKNDSMTVTGNADFGSVINSYTDKCPTGYALEKTENLPLTIGVNESENVIKVFYKKNVFDLTIHYVYAEGGAVAAPDHTENVTFNSTYSVTSPTINGYTADKTVVSGTMPAENVEVTVTYTKRSDLSYTVHYYWNGTTESVAPDKTVPGQSFNASVTESPVAVTGCTPVNEDSKAITIGTGKNEITFYYYKNVELTANSDEVTYDGEEHSVSGFTGAPEGVTFNGISASGSGTDVGEYDVTFAEGTLNTVDTTNKYIVTKATPGKLTITADATAIVVKIKGNTLTKTYDGNEYTVEGYDVVSISDTRYTATDFSFTGTAEAKGTNVKTDGYSMGLTAAQFKNTSKNFSNVEFVVEEDGKLTIEKRTVTLTSESGEKEYDGTPLTKPNVTVGGDGFVTGEVTDIKATGSVTYVSDGEVTNTITYTTGEKFNAGNYNISKSEGKLKITDRAEKYEITVKANSGEKTYDGTPLDVSGFENLEFTVNGQKYTVSGLTASKTGTNVSDSGAVVVEGTAVVKDANGIDVTKQFKVNTEDGQLTINPRTVTLTSGSASKQYDGTPLTKDEVKVTGDGFADGEGATYDVTGAITNVAENKPNNNTFTYTLSEGTTAGNYVIEIMYGTLEITPVAAEVTVEIKGHTTDAIYDATEKTAEGYDVISISNDLYTKDDFALTGKDKVTGIAAGEYDMGLAFENISKNFSKVTFVVEDGKLTIAKRDVTVTGESATKVYNGQTQEINGYTVDNLVEGHEMTGVTYSAKGKDPGKYDGSFTGSQIVIKDAAGTDVTINYNVKPVIGVLTITQPSHPTRPSTPTKDVTSVKTADGSQMTLWMSMMLASAAGIVFLGKKRKEEQ